MDLDGDAYLSVHELDYVYEAGMQRMDIEPFDIETPSNLKRKASRGNSDWIRGSLKLAGFRGNSGPIVPWMTKGVVVVRP